MLLTVTYCYYTYYCIRVVLAILNNVLECSLKVQGSREMYVQWF